MVRLVHTCLFICFAAGVFAQDFSFGFKAGLNFNTFKGDAEQDDSGNTLEEFTTNTGFQVGATFTWKPTELMGLRGEFMFAQKGGRRSFNGPSYYFFYDLNGTQIPATGNRRMDINVTNSYFELPVMGYVKPVKWLEIYAGGYAGALISSSAFGELTFKDGVTLAGDKVSDEISHELDFNYFGDKPRSVSYANPPATIKIKGENIPYPQIAGAYFEFTEDPDNLYKIFDAGVLGGISIFFNKGLYLSGRLSYGLLDVTRSKADVSLVKLDGGSLISRNDDDRNFSIQAVVGFSF
mgnify:CR=1 FL=1